MKDKILSFLKTKLNGLGVPDTYLNGVAETYSRTIKDEKDIETTITDGVIEVLKFSAGHIQIEEDRRTAAAVKKFQEKHGLDENGQPIKKAETKKKKKEDVDSDDSDDADDSKMPAWAKKILADNTELKQKFEGQEKEKTLAALADKVLKHEKLKDIPASYLKGRNLIINSEAEVDQLVTSIEADYNGFKQEMAEKGVVISVPPSSTASVKEGEATGKAIAAKRNANSSDGVKGKEV